MQTRFSKGVEFKIKQNNSVKLNLSEHALMKQISKLMKKKILKKMFFKQLPSITGEVLQCFKVWYGFLPCQKNK